MIELSLSRDAYKRYEQEIGKSQSRTDRENAFVAQRESTSSMPMKGPKQSDKAVLIEK